MTKAVVAVAPFDRPSDYDLSYLARESPVQPLHFVMQLHVEGAVTVEQVRAHVLSRLPHVPVLARTLREPLGGGRPVWVDDPSFDVARHVVVGTGDLVADLVDPVRRGSPLWRLSVVPDEAGTLLRLAVQHAQMDGGLLGSTLQTLFSADTAAAAAPWVPVAGPSALGLAARAAKARAARALRRRPPARAVVRSPGPTSGTRAVGGFRLPLSALDAVRAATGATVNDLYLAAVARGLASYQEQPHDTLAVVPRDTRAPEEAGRVGNRHVALVVRLPVTAASPAEALEAVRADVAGKKGATRTAGTDERKDVEVVCTNVRWRGEHVVAGHRVRAYRAAVPLQESTVAVVAMSYAGTLSVDVTVDAAVHPDVDRLVAGIERGLAELAALA